MARAADAIVLVGGLGLATWAVLRHQQQAGAQAEPAVHYVNVPQARDDGWKGVLLSSAVDVLGEIDFGNTGLGRTVGDIFRRDTPTSTSRSSRGGGVLVPVQPPTTRVSAPTGGDVGSRLTRDLMSDFGLTRAQAAGFAGNLDHESGGFRTLQEINPLVPGSRGGYGYAQWTGPRRRAFESWTSARGLDPTTYDANYGFLKHELTNTSERSVLPRLRAAGTVEDATRVVQDRFLRPGIPHTSSRIERARRYA